MAEYENCRLLLVDKKISTARDIVGVLEGAIRGGYPLMIMAEDIEQEALATLVVNKLRGSLKARRPAPRPAAAPSHQPLHSKAPTPEPWSPRRTLARRLARRLAARPLMGPCPRTPGACAGHAGPIRYPGRVSASSSLASPYPSMKEADGVQGPAALAPPSSPPGTAASSPSSAAHHCPARGAVLLGALPAGAAWQR